MAVTKQISTDFRLFCDRAGGTTFEQIDGLVDVGLPSEAPRRDKTDQDDNLRVHLPSIRSRRLSFTLRWDHADATAARTLHSELWADAISRVKGNWKLHFAPGTTGAERWVFRANIAEIDIPSILGEVRTATVELQICGVVTKDTIP